MARSLAHAGRVLFRRTNITMKPSLLEYLTCPETGEPFELTIHQEEDGQIKEGRLVGSKTGRSYPITNFVPRFVKTDEYASTFSSQRRYVKRHFNHYKRDTSGFSLFYPTTGFSKERLCQGPTLEVGCGYGRFMDVVQQEGGEIVGVDLSTHSIDLAQSFVGLRPRVHLVQCDLFKLPFKKGIFNSIYSIGVLHHTPSFREGFSTLPGFLAPSGQISVWVYHPSNQADVTEWRKITSTWSPPILYVWCVINQIMFSWIRMIPIVRWKFNKVIPGSVPKPGQHFWLRVLEDFDNLSPKYASSHTAFEVVECFRQSGLANIKILNRPTAVTGYRK